MSTLYVLIAAIEIWKLVVQTTLLIYASPRLTVTLPVMVVIVYLVQRYYLKVSRVLRFQDMQSRAQIFTSFIETVSVEINTNIVLHIRLHPPRQKDYQPFEPSIGKNTMRRRTLKV